MPIFDAIFPMPIFDAIFPRPIFDATFPSPILEAAPPISLPIPARAPKNRRSRSVGMLSLTVISPLGFGA